MIFFDMATRWVARLGVAALGLGWGLSPCVALPLGSVQRSKLGEYHEELPFELHFTWALAQPMNNLRVLGAPRGAALQDFAPEPVLVHLRGSRADGGELSAEFEPRRAGVQSGQRPPHGAARLATQGQGGSAATYRAELLRQFDRRQPSGKRHCIRHILLSCEQTSPQGNTVYLQLLEVDATLGSADLIPCGATPPRYAALLPTTDYRSSAPTGLPEKYNGSPLRRDMLRLLYAMAAVDSPTMAAKGTPEIAAFAWQLAARAPMPNTPWPDCWGDAAQDARTIARHLTPTLLYFHENDCFGCQELADFINSPNFARIFGENFTEHPPMPDDARQDKPIEYTTLPRQ